MTLAWMSVGALVIAVTLSCFTTINIGVLAIALALIVGVVLGGMTANEVLAGFPTELLLTLMGVTLLFAIAQENGTLTRLTERMVRLCCGHAGLLPMMFFALGFVLATVGAGATPASALLAPPAMAVAGRAGIPPLLMVIMCGNGTLAGTLSPFAPTGIVAHGVMARIGLGGVEWQTFAYNAFAHTLVAFGGYLLLGGWKLFRTSAGGADAGPQPLGVMAWRHWFTTFAIVVLIVAVAGWRLDVGMVAFILSAGLLLGRTVNEGRAIQRMPWGVIMMVTGVTVLIALLQKTQGLALITDAIARIATPSTIEAVVAFGTGLVSVYSSTSGVVLPAFLPMVPTSRSGLATSR